MVDNSADENAVTVTDTDAGSVRENATAARQRSDIPFPYIPLAEVMAMVNVVERRGHRCQSSEIAADLDQQMTSGAFRSRLSAGRMFGVIETQRGEVSLTELGLQVCYPETQHAALAEAFLNVPLYKKLYDKYAGGRLPGAHGIEQEMVRMGVPAKQVSKARQVLMRSAETAGFLGSGRDRLVRPPTSSLPSASIGAQVPSEPRAQQAEAVPMGNHPLIAGLVAKLPAEGQRFTPKQRQRWLDAAKVNLELIYAADDEDDGELVVEPPPNGQATAHLQSS